MVSTRSTGKPRGRPRKKPLPENETNKQKEEEEEITQKNEEEEEAEYEKSRAQRIKENTERMKTLGIFELSKNLKPSSSISKPSSSSFPRKPKPATSAPSRRSSRIKDLPEVSYNETTRAPKGDKANKKVEIHIPEGERPEVYTEEDEKLLGDSKEAWTLLVDGYDEDGMRMYDPHAGKSCHQCRQKTLGHRTECCKCKMVSGQFCGDCLYMRYGENVLEVNKNPKWVCPVCRGICNCSRCRRDKGWEPTGPIYRKAATLGFKSVAHYLIQTRRGQSTMEEEVCSENAISEDEKEPVAVSMPASAAEKNEIEDGMDLDSDEEYNDNEDDDDVDDDDDGYQ